MIIDFRRNTDDIIGVNPPKTTRSIIPQINGMKSGTGIGFGRNSGDGIPPINIRSFGLFDRGTWYFSDISVLWHGSVKSESEKPGSNRIFENAERENNSEVEKVGCKNSVILNNVDSIDINTDLNHLNQVDLNNDD